MFSNLLSSTVHPDRYAKAGLARMATLAFAVIFASGCSLLSGQLDRAAKGAGKVVKEYCENVTIPEIREEVRAAVNKHASPHSVAIECVDKSAPVLKSDEPASVAPSEAETSGDGANEADPTDSSALNFDTPGISLFAGNKSKAYTNPIIIIERRKVKAYEARETLALLPVIIIERRKTKTVAPTKPKLA